MIFHHTCILTGSRDLAAKCDHFYTAHFGMEATFKSVTAESDYLFYADNVNPSISPFEIIGKSFDERETNFLKRYGPGLDHICFRVEDLHTVYEDMSRSGVKFHVPPYAYADFLIAWCRDPSGVEVELLQAEIEFPHAGYESTTPKAHYHHIAIQAGSAELARTTSEFYCKSIGLCEVPPVKTAANKDRVYLRDASNAPHPWIEISSVAHTDNERAFLEKNGPGLEHHGFVVEDADNYSRFLNDRGVALSSDVVEIGNIKKFYLHDPAGICVQVSQIPAGIESGC